MGRLGSGLIGVFAVGVLPVAASAQVPTLTTSTPQSASKSTDVGGTTALDVISLSAVGPGTPLRNGNVIPNSETVQLDGRTLSSGIDYMVDYAVGVIYLMVSQKAGQSLIVSYRYKSGAAAGATGSSQFMGMTPFQYALLPGSLNMMAGLGMAERGEDGRAMSSNLFGWNNVFKLGQTGSLSGIYAFGDRMQTNSTQGFASDPGAAPTKSTLAAGQSQMIIQNYKSQVLGGNTSFDYQNISKGFTGFQTASASGMDDDSVKQLKAEKGLTRMGFSLDNLKFGGINFSDSHREVKDSGNGISWDTMGISTGGFKLNWGAQAVDNRFNRFKDLGESNKDQLTKESGLKRSYMSGEWAQKFGTLSYTNNKIVESTTKKEITQQIWSLDTSKIKFSMSDEAVDNGFARFDSLLAPEKTAFGRQAGTQRQTIDLSSSFLGNNTPIAFNEKKIDSAGAKYLGDDISVTSKAWSLQHSDRKVSSTFSSIGTMSDAEIDSSVKSIAMMYGSDIKPSPGDRAEFLATHGLDRSFNGFTSDGGPKGWKLSAGEIDYKGMTDTAKVDNLSLANKNVTLTMRKENLGQTFNEITSMMDFEKARLGAFPGLDRTDIDLAMTTGKRKMDFSTLGVQTETGTAQRALFNYSDPKLELQAGVRNVSSGFADAPNLVDPGKDVLNQLRGFSEGDVKLKWQLLNNLTLNSQLESAYDPQSNETWRTKNNVLDWSPDKNTQVNLTQMDQLSTDPVYTMFNDSVEKLSVTRNMGRYGTLKLLTERDDFSGLSSIQESQSRQYIAWDTKISASTSFKTEQTFTNYANGAREDINSNTVSHDLSKRAGVSVTETQVTREGSNNENHRNYGFWYDLGGGVRLSYGYARQDLAEDQSTSNSSFMLGKAPVAGQPAPTAAQPGQIGNVVLGAGYFANQWQAGDRTQTNGNIALSNAKPFRLGWFQDIKFNMNLDTATDHAAMMHENKLVGAVARVGSNTIGYEYKSQMDPTGLRAIDRSVKLATDPSDKKKVNVSFSYKQRTMTDDTQTIIRDYSFTFRPVKNFILTNQVQTNPEVANTNVLLGSLPQASKSNKWKLDYKQGANLTVGGSWEELKNDQTHSLSRTAGLNMKLFEKSGSPITIFYGLEEADAVDLWRTTTRYSIEYDQKPASNQTFSLLLGSLSYEHSTPIGQNPRNLTLRVNYQFSF